MHCGEFIALNEQDAAAAHLCLALHATAAACGY
jgi:hypothetical protein